MCVEKRGEQVPIRTYQVLELVKRREKFNVGCLACAAVYSSNIILEVKIRLFMLSVGCTPVKLT